MNSALQLPCCSLAVVGWCLCWVGAEGWGFLPPCSWCCRTDGLCLWELHCAALLSHCLCANSSPCCSKTLLGVAKTSSEQRSRCKIREKLEDAHCMLCGSCSFPVSTSTCVCPAETFTTRSSCQGSFAGSRQLFLTEHSFSPASIPAGEQLWQNHR